MNTIKNIKLVSNLISDELLEKLELGAHSYLRFSRITFKVSNVDHVKKSITIEVRQDHNPAGVYFDNKTLSDRGKEYFRPFFPDWAIHTVPVPYSAPEVEIVTPNWLPRRMEELHVKANMIAKDTGIRRADLSNYINGVRPMSQPVKAMFYYYFKCIELERKLMR